MTTRELYNEMLKVLDGTKTDGWDEMADTITAMLEKMDAQNAARKVKNAEKAAEAQAAKQPIRDALLAAVGDAENPKTASMLIEDAGLTDTVKPASVPSLMRPFVENGTVAKVDMKVPGHGTQRGYVLA